MVNDRSHRRYFFVRCIITSSMSGGGGDTFGYAGFRMHRFANPITWCSPRLAKGRAVYQLQDQFDVGANMRDTKRHSAV